MKHMAQTYIIGLAQVVLLHVHTQFHLSQISLVSAKNYLSGARTWMCVTREQYRLS